MVEATVIDDCWNRIGVWSKEGASCPQLAAAVHCRNCGVYRAAGRALLEREIPPAAREEWARQYAQPAVRTLRHGTSFTVFRIGVEWLAVPTLAVKRIGAPVPVRRIPHRGNPVLRGIANLSGELELVVSLEALLGIESAAELPAEKGRRQRNRPIPRMVRVVGDSGSFAFVAAEVLGTHRHEESLLEPLPSTLQTAAVRHVRGTVEAAGRRVGVLDLNLVSRNMELALR